MHLLNKCSIFVQEINNVGFYYRTHIFISNKFLKIMGHPRYWLSIVVIGKRVVLDWKHLNLSIKRLNWQRIKRIRKFLERSISVFNKRGCSSLTIANCGNPLDGDNSLEPTVVSVVKSDTGCYRYWNHLHLERLPVKWIG